MVGTLLACNVKCRTKWLGDLFVHRPPSILGKNLHRHIARLISGPITQSESQTPVPSQKERFCLICLYEYACIVFTLDEVSNYLKNMATGKLLPKRE